MSTLPDTSVPPSNETFIPAHYPGVTRELTSLKEAIAHTAIYFKVEMIITFLRDHSLRTDWIKANPFLAKLLTAGSLKTTQLEMLFESSMRNKPFLHALEGFISIQLLKPAEKTSSFLV